MTCRNCARPAVELIERVVDRTRLEREDEDLVLQLDFAEPRLDRDGLRLSAILRVVEGAKKGKLV